jgi:hypothetical protein
MRLSRRRAAFIVGLVIERNFIGPSGLFAGIVVAQPPLLIAGGLVSGLIITAAFESALHTSADLRICRGT